MQTGAEGVNVLLGWCNLWSKVVAKGLLYPESRILSQKRAKECTKKEQGLYHFPAVQGIIMRD